MWGFKRLHRSASTEFQVGFGDQSVMVLTELIILVEESQLAESQGMHIGASAIHAVRSGTSPKPAVGLKFEGFF